MKMRFVMGMCLSVLLTVVVACSSSSSSSDDDSGDDGDTGACSLDDNTTSLATSSLGCSLLDRDTSSCEASRTAQGLSGFWLKFSCRVTLTKSGSDVTITVDSQPDYTSPYFATSNACYESGFPSGRAANPNTLAASSISMTVPYSPGTPTGSTGTAMSMGVVGIAINGVAVFSNAAAPGDSIYDEVATFDKCEGHPAGTKYHYHIEPTTATDNDNNFIGIMRDGFPIYGRKDSGGATPTLDKATGGAHLGTTVDSPSTSVYHYHVNYQSSGSDNAYFITSGYYLINPTGACTGCN